MSLSEALDAYGVARKSVGFSQASVQIREDGAYVVLIPQPKPGNPNQVAVRVMADFMAACAVLGLSGIDVLRGWGRE